MSRVRNMVENVANKIKLIRYAIVEQTCIQRDW